MVYKEQDNKPHCVSCGKVICGDLDGIVKLHCPKCRCGNVVAGVKDNDGTYRYIVWQTTNNNEGNVYRYIYECMKKLQA